jgi:hypothetical protein
MQRQFSPSDIERIKHETSQWYVGWQAFTSGTNTPKARKQKLAKNSLDVGARLESELDNGERFHSMIRDCAQRLRLGPEFNSCPFEPPKLKRM